MATAAAGGESIGTARIDVAVDMSQLELGIQRAQDRMVQMSQEGQGAYAGLNAAERRRIASLNRQVDTLGMTREQQLAYNIVLRTEGQLQTDLLGKLAATTNAMGQQGTVAAKNAIQFNQYGLSVKQTEAALRQVPAQLTDIFVSLQGGQAPLTVLLQQGGQLRDIFGGATPAIRAMGAQLMRLINPVTLLAAATGGLAFAFHQADSEFAGFEQSLISSGNKAGVTAEQMRSLAAGMDEFAGVTRGQAAEALRAAADSGVLMGEQFVIASQAAAQMSNATGRAVSDTIDEFKQLAKDPVNALLALNEQYNFLQAEQLEHVRLLQEEGNHQDAATEAARIYANVINERAPEIVANLGFVSGAWHNIKQESIDAGNWMIQSLSDIDNYMKGLAQNPWFRMVAGTNPILNGLVGAPDADFSAVRGGADSKRAIDSNAARQLQTIINGNLSREEQQRREILKIRNLGVAAGWNELQIQKAINASNAKFAESQKRDRGMDRSLTKEGLQGFKDQLAERQAAIKADSAVLKAEYSANLVSQEQYFAGTRELIVREQQAQEEALLGQIRFLRSRNVTGKEAIDVQREAGKLEAELTKVRTEAAAELQVLSIQEQAYFKAREQALKDYRQALDLGTESLRGQVQSQIDSILMSQRQFDTQQRVNQVLREAAQAERELARERRKGEISPEEYAEKLELQRRHTAERVAIEQGAYAAISVAQQDWRAGMLAGLQDWVDEASDVAGQVRRITVNALDRIADGFAEMALKGKFHWRDMLADILSELVRFFAKQAVLQFIKYFAGSFMGSIGGSFAAPAAGSAAEGAAYDSWINNLGGSSGQMQPIASSVPMSAMRASGGGNSVAISMPISITGGGSAGQVDPAMQQRHLQGAQAELEATVKRTVHRMMRPGGALWKAGVGASA